MWLVDIEPVLLEPQTRTDLEKTVFSVSSFYIFIHFNIVLNNCPVWVVFIKAQSNLISLV